jgi:hypothetical protein
VPGRFPITILVGLAACTWVLVLIVEGSKVGWDFAKPFSLVVGVISVALAAFDRAVWQAVWHWPGVRKMVGRPNVEGTYWGAVRTEWVDPTTGQKPPPTQAALVIRQSYTALTLTLFTDESASSTIAASVHQEADGRFLVASLYRNEPRLSVQERSRMHHGAVRLHLAGPDSRLHGSYWTDRSTHGEMEFSRISPKRASDFTEAKGMTANSEETNRRKKRRWWRLS